MYRKDKKTGDGDNKQGWPTTSKTKAIREKRLQTENEQHNLKGRKKERRKEGKS